MLVYPIVFLTVAGLVYGALWKVIGQDPAVIVGIAAGVWTCIQVKRARWRRWANKGNRRKAGWPEGAIECPRCHGSGKTTGLSSTTRGTSFINLTKDPCWNCFGLGYLIGGRGR